MLRTPPRRRPVTGQPATPTSHIRRAILRTPPVTRRSPVNSNAHSPHSVRTMSIWTIMVAAKLDQSRILVTKFSQNRFTLKGRSAGQRQTDTQTNSGKNNGPSGLQSGQQTHTDARDHRSLSPSNTKSLGSRPTSIPSGIVVHPAVWPQRTLAENWGNVPL